MPEITINPFLDEAKAIQRNPYSRVYISQAEKEVATEVIIKLTGLEHEHADYIAQSVLTEIRTAHFARERKIREDADTISKAKLCS